MVKKIDPLSTARHTERADMTGMTGMTDMTDMTDAADETNAERSSPRPLRADALRNRRKLLAVASEAFAELGPEAPLDDIARRAGVGIGTLYRHFPTRQALLEAVYREQIEALTARAEALLDAPSPGKAVSLWLRAVLDHIVTHRALNAALMNGEGSEVVASCKAQMRAAGAALLARAQQAGDVRADLDIGDVLRLVHGIAVATEKASGSAASANRCLLVMLDGLRHQEPSTTQSSE